MSKKDYYTIENNIEKIKIGKNSGFLDPVSCIKVCAKLKGYNYKIYYPYEECEKTIIYTKKIPKIKVLEIISKEKLMHREIMGSLYALNIDFSMFGDIIIYKNHYYILIIDSIYDYILQTFNIVGNKAITLKEVDINILKGYTRKYQEIELIVSSLRIDNIVSRLIGNSRDLVKKKFYNEEIILNYEPCNKPNYKLKENDIFSIRKNGKYKFDSIVKNTKRNHYVIKCLKYIDNQSN